ncbi:MAG TPA: serine/threonine-protein kinase [Ktedonobacteraceae bacterium]|jgi:serine/threonine protein kinase|nr:serine/threonine-protein kinase [Ktedonobacteraceae bacterium]
MLSLETIEAPISANNLYSFHASEHRAAFQTSRARDFQLENYRLLTLLGSGGFAQVYLAEHRVSGKRVALKIAHSGIGAARRAQFSAEAALHMRLQHPHIIPVHAYEEQTFSPFLILDYAAGGTMRQYAPGGTQLSLPTVVNVVKQVASALYYVHQMGVVHRDVKPENLLIQPDMQVMLSDFGNARIIYQSNTEERSDTSGTASYMAPEQLQQKLCVASDQYALGVTTYEWLSGVRPFSGAPLRIALQHLNSRPPSFQEVGAHVPAEVEAVVMKALEKDPQQRFSNIWEFALALERAAVIR